MGGVSGELAEQLENRQLYKRVHGTNELHNMGLTDLVQQKGLSYAQVSELETAAADKLGLKPHEFLIKLPMTPERDLSAAAVEELNFIERDGSRVPVSEASKVIRVLKKVNGSQKMAVYAPRRVAKSLRVGQVYNAVVDNL